MGSTLQDLERNCVNFVRQHFIGTTTNLIIQRFHGGILWIGWNPNILKFILVSIIPHEGHSLDCSTSSTNFIILRQQIIRHIERFPDTRGI